MIPANKAVVGTKYLSRTNLPVQLVEIKPDGVVLRCLFADEKEVNEKLEYPLKPYDVNLIPETTKMMMDERTLNKERRQVEGSDVKKETSTMDTTVSTPETKKKRGGISAIIDPLLFEGGHTVAEIVNLVAEKSPEFAEGRNLRVNVLVRLSTLKKRGFKLEENEQKQIKLVK